MSWPFVFQKMRCEWVWLHTGMNLWLFSVSVLTVLAWWASVLYCSNFLLEFRKLCIKWRTLHNVKKYKEVQSNLAVRNFLVAPKLFLNAKTSLFLWSKWQIGHRKWFLNTNFFLIKPFLIAKFDWNLDLKGNHHLGPSLGLENWNIWKHF